MSASPGQTPRARSKKKPRAEVAPAAASPRAARPGPMRVTALGGFLAVATFGAGVLIGWYARHAQPTPSLGVPDLAGSATIEASAACLEWQQKLCAGAGSESAGCGHARALAELLPRAACEAALAELPATLATMKARRARAPRPAQAVSQKVCEELVNKLCGDLGEQSQGCRGARASMARLPGERCQEMLDGYDRFLPSLRRMEEARQQGTAAPHGSSAPSAPPGTPP